VISISKQGANVSDVLPGVLIGVTLGLVVAAALLLHTAIKKRRMDRGRLDAAAMDFESQAFLSAVYSVTWGPNEQVPVGSYWRQRGLTGDQAHVVLTRLMSRGAIGVTYASEWSRLAARFFCVNPSSVVLARREYDERTVAAGASRALVGQASLAVDSLGVAELEKIASALAQDGAQGIADTVVAALRADNKPTAVDTVLKVVSAISDGQALWQITSALLAQLVRAL